MQMRKVVKPGWNLEYVMWMFTRLSGLAITLLAVISVAAAFMMGARTQMDMGTLMRWTFFPNSNHVLDSEVPDVTVNWANGFWQIMQVLVIFFGVTHGFNGLRVVIEDYTTPGLWQLFWRAVVFLLWIFMTLVAVYVVFTY